MISLINYRGGGLVAEAGLMNSCNLFLSHSRADIFFPSVNIQVPGFPKRKKILPHFHCLTEALSKPRRQQNTTKKNKEKKPWNKG